MTTAPNTITVLGGTGKTGRRVAARLAASGVPHRTAARAGAEVRFDWDDDATWDAALSGTSALYLVAPPYRLDHAGTVAALLDRAEAAGVAHVVVLSARGADHAPDESPLRAIELDAQRRTAFTSTILRPGWFMQDFTEWLWRDTIAAEGVIATTAGDAAEAFIDADDIAEVAVAALRRPGELAGAELELTGPSSLTFDAVAERIGRAAGRPVVHRRLDRAAWVEVASTSRDRIPADYAGLLADVLALGAGAAATDHVERITGRPPRSFDDFLAGIDAAAVWAPAPAPA